jgi:two-component system CheB/CheR fusion protein
MPQKNPPRKRVGKRAEPVPPAVHPEAASHDTPESSLPFPIVAVGASAGGVEALGEFLKALRPDTGMAFVVIQHLAPTHSSLLPEILSRSTAMKVRQVEDGMAVEPDTVYVIPPDAMMVLAHGRLKLSPRGDNRAVIRTIDHFMRSLAEEHGHKAIGVILSGSGNDGSLGIEEIKAAAGIALVQDESAEHGDMPRSAIARGAVDYVLPPAQIASEIGRIARHKYLGSPAADGRLEFSEGDLNRVLEILRQQTGVDFSNYKRNTIHRRVTRRLMLHKSDSANEYMRFLQGNPAEVEALYQDVLINVTSFFRDAEAYEALKATVFPKLVGERNPHDPVRVWVLGCATGEEAYSIAMCFTEFLETTGKRVPLQVFATDLNGAGIEKARAAIYPKGIVQDVSPERLRRFFVDIDGSYRINKPIRDMCVFARQNVLADPPFSRIDMIACRNMMIYLDSMLQQRMVPLMHYALRGEGFLWLGSSETIGAYRELFDIVDVKHKVYAKKRSTRRPIEMPASTRWVPHEASYTSAPREGPGPDPQREADRVLLTRYAPPAVLLNEELEIVQFRGETGAFLSPAPGKASLSLLKMLREGLMVAVRGAIARARRDQVPTREEGLKVKSANGWRSVDVMVLPLKAGAARGGAFLVVFEEPTGDSEARARLNDAEARAARAEVAPDTGGKDREAARLKQELAATRDYLQSVIEQQEAANEELQSANEEVQSANEELQSINEELETSKEEIQSANEELATVNDELQNRNHELSQSNNDLVNLLSSVQMAIVMLGSDMRIRRFTPAAEKLLNLIPSDVGRPLGDIKLNLRIDDIGHLVGEVIDSVTPREREIQDRQGRWYSLRVRPYRTLDNKIDGAVILLVDIDAMKQAGNALRESEARFEVLADSAPVLIWLNDLEGCRFVNRAFEDFVGALESEIRASDPAKYIHPDDRAGYLATYQEAVAKRHPFQARLRFRRADAEYRWMKVVGTPRMTPNGQLMGYVGCTFDITDMKEAESALIELDRGKNEFLAMLAHELRNPLSGVRNAARLLAVSAEEAAIEQARGIIERQTANMVRMVDDLLDVSRISHGKIQLRPEPVDICALSRRVIEVTEGERQAAGQTLVASIPDDPAWVQGDALRLDQTLSNLLNNASKFTRHGGRIWVTVEREPAAVDSDTRPQVAIRVRDNGVGIEPALLPRIFDLFVQSDRVSERSRTGIGLGLTLARRLVELHGGSIEAFSAGNALGSEFVMRLPLLETPQEGRIAGRARKAPARISAQRILVVDDNVDSAESLRLMLAASGHEVNIAGDGATAISAVARLEPEVVLLDIALPDMDGYTVARKLRTTPAGRDALIVAVSGYGRDEDIVRSRDAGIDAHLVKPLDPEALEDVIRRRAAGR